MIALPISPIPMSPAAAPKTTATKAAAKASAAKPAAPKAAKPEILMVANASGETIAVAKAKPKAAAEDIENHAAEIVAICRMIKREMKQEAVSLEINGELFLT